MPCVNVSQMMRHSLHHAMGHSVHGSLHAMGHSPHALQHEITRTLQLQKAHTLQQEMVYVWSRERVSN